MKSDININNKDCLLNWKEFEISRLFTIKSPAARTIKSYSEGKTPYVSSGSFNNGIVSYLEPMADEKIEKGQCITVSPLDGSAFFQEEDFLGRGGARSAISLLYNLNLTRYNALFICTIIKIMAEKFGYNDALTSDNLRKLRIKLPIEYKEDGSRVYDSEKRYSDEGFVPDWGGMEKCMKELKKKVDKSLDSFQAVSLSKQESMDVSGWREFPIADFFDFSLPKGDLQVKKVEDGDIPLITPSNFNNGLLMKISAESESTLYAANSLTVDMFGNAYFQEANFFVTAHGHVNVLVPKICINKYVGCFMASSIKKMFFYKYGFSDMCTQKVLKQEVIVLPVKKDASPDWEYMEEYMKKMEKTAVERMNLLI